MNQLVEYVMWHERQYDIDELYSIKNKNKSRLKSEINYLFTYKMYKKIFLRIHVL
jgi:hypothetical protein